MAFVLSDGNAKAVTFSDDFNNEAFTNAAWGNELGSWTASGGVYAAQSPSNGPNTHSFVLGLNLSDFSVDVTVNNATVGGVWLRAAEDPPVPPTIGVAGVLFAWAHEDMYWHVVLPGQTFYGGASNLVNVGPFPDSFSLHIEVKGNNYSAFVNGLLITSLYDANFTFGQVALYSGGPESFDDFSVSAVPLPAALPLFATGLGALGLLGWRRKRKAAFAAA